MTILVALIALSSLFFGSSMVERLYNRQVFVEVGVPGNDFRRWEDLRVAARIQKGRTSSPNTGEIDIFNLSKESVSHVQQDGAIVRLFAGYEIPRQVFLGEINPDGVALKKQGVDRVLSIEAQDGGGKFRTSRINKSFNRGTSLSEIFDELAGATGAPLGAISIPKDAQISEGVTLAGDVSAELDRFARSLDLDWSYQDGALQVLPRGEGAPDEAILVSSAPDRRNLIGEPAPGKDGLEVRSLLDGRHIPGRRVKIESEEYEGIYKILGVEHVLDSGWDQAFYSDLILREI